MTTQTKINKINDEIVKMKAKIADYQSRLRELERQKTEIENAEIVAIVRSIDVAPEELAVFIEAYKKQQTGVPPTPDGKEEPVNEE